MITFALSTKTVQTWIIKKATTTLSEELKTKVSIGAINFKLFNKVDFIDLYIEDQQGDTLFYFKRLGLLLNHYNTEKRFILLDKLELVGTKVHFYQHKDQKDFNYDFFINYFNNQSGGGGGSWVVKSKKVQLYDSEFMLWDQNSSPPDDRKFDEGHLVFSNINGTLKDFTLVDDSIQFQSTKFSCNEKSGLEIKKLITFATIYNKEMIFDKLTLETNHSKLQDYLAFSYDSYKSYNDFLDSVKIVANLKNSSIDFKDLAIFSDYLQDYIFPIEVSGQAKGTIRYFRTKNLDIRYGKNTMLAGDIRMKGLPKIDVTFIDADIKSLTTVPDDIRVFVKKIALPVEIDRLGPVIFKGQFLGFYNDFVAFGNLKSELGELESDLNMKIAENKPEVYSGNLKAIDFDIGKMYGLTALGKSTFDLTIDGSGLELNNFKAKIKGNIDQANINNYNYQNLKLDGAIEKKFFKGEASIKDENIDLVFKGDINLNDKQPTFDFMAVVNHANLKALKLDTAKSIISTEMVMNFKGNKIDNITGTAELKNLNIERGNSKFHLDHTQLFSGLVGTERTIIFNSDIADIHVLGNFNFSNLDKAYNEFLSTLFPDYYPISGKAKIPISFELNAEIKKPNIISSLFKTRITMSSGYTKGKYNSTEESLKFWSNLDSISYDDIVLYKWDLNLEKKPGKPLNMSTETFGIKQGSEMRSNYLLATASILPNYLDFTVTVSDTAHQAEFFTYGNGAFGKDSVTIRLEDGYLSVYEQQWKIDNGNKLDIFNGNTTVSNFTLLSKNERLDLNGFIYKDDKAELGLSLSNFNLKILTPIIGSSFVEELSGIANGTLDISGKWYKPLVNSDLIIENLSFNNDTLGDFKLISKASGRNALEMDVYSSMQKGMLKDMEIIGKINLGDVKDNLDLKMTWKNGEIKPLEQFFEGVASDFRGNLSAVVYVSGSFDQPTFNGSAYLDSCSVNVDYTNTRYALKGNLMLTDKKFTLNFMDIYDQMGNRGNANGYIVHDLFDDFRLEVKLSNLENFMALNTKKGDNELFWGTAILDGSCLFRGPLDDIYMNITAKSRKGTKIYIPLEWESDNSTVSYISFAKIADQNGGIKRKKYDLDGIAIDFNFELTPDAYIELIFDELMDDRIKGRGTGNLKMEINTFGDFSMYGNYIIETGTYHFTALNFISKEFNITNGSRITWDGNPLDGKMKIEAVKREYAAPADLLVGLVPTEELQNYRTKIPVDCQLFLNGLLFSPEISFGLSFPNQNSVSSTGFNAFNSVVSRIKTDVEEINRQVFSLLVLGSFIPPGFSNGNTTLASSTSSGLQNTVNNSVGDLISNQLSNWITQIDPKWQIGIDWQKASEATKKELIFSVKRQFLNDRLEFDGSVDANAINGRNPYNLNIQYNITSDGRFKIRGFSKFANDPTLGTVSNISTTGVGFFYRKQFDSFRLKKKTDNPIPPSPAIKPEEPTEPKKE
jgi:hypothetical protein